jgi:hypothetical protein
MHLKVFVKLKKTLKTLSSGQKTQTNPKTQKKPTKPKKPTGLVFLKKNRVFSNPALKHINFDFNSDPAFFSDVDPDSASKNNANPDQIYLTFTAK